MRVAPSHATVSAGRQTNRTVFNDSTQAVLCTTNPRPSGEVSSTIALEHAILRLSSACLENANVWLPF